VARNLGLDDVVDHFTLIGDELEPLRNKSGATRLGFAVLLKYVIWRGRFPTGSHELPDDVVTHLGRQARVPAGELASYDFASRTAQRHRTEIRAYSGFRECSVADSRSALHRAEQALLGRNADGMKSVGRSSSGFRTTNRHLNEDQLTRAAMIVLRLVPLAREALMRQIGAPGLAQLASFGDVDIGSRARRIEHTRLPQKPSGPMCAISSLHVRTPRRIRRRPSLVRAPRSRATRVGDHRISRRLGLGGIGGWGRPIRHSRLTER
jgi:hypothetical protein